MGCYLGPKLGVRHHVVRIEPGLVGGRRICSPGSAITIGVNRSPIIERVRAEDRGGGCRPDLPDERHWVVRASLAAARPLGEGDLQVCRALLAAIGGLADLDGDGGIYITTVMRVESATAAVARLREVLGRSGQARAWSASIEAVPWGPGARR